MKSSILLAACTALSLLAGCDSGSNPTQIETKVVSDTVTLNDWFAKKSDIVHGRWLVTTSVDTADMWLFQNGDSVNAVLYWGKSTDWRLSGKLNGGNYELFSNDRKIELYLFPKASKDHLVSKVQVTVIDRSKSPIYVNDQSSAERRL